MVVSAGPWSSEKAEMNILEINKKLRPQLAEKKQQFRNSKERFLVTQVACFLASRQNKYKFEECKDLIQSMLRDELQVKEEKLVEQLGQAEELRQYKVLVHSQSQELGWLREKLREGRDASRSLNQHLQALIPPDEPDNSQGQDLREQLAEGCRLTENLIHKLSLENDEDVDDDVYVEETEKVRESCAPREVQKVEERNSRRTYWRNVLSLVQIVTVLLTPASLTGKPKSHLTKTKLTLRWLSPELPEMEEQDVPQDSLDEVYLTRSLPHDLSDCQQPYSSTWCSLEDQLACSALDVASPTQADCPYGPWSGDLSHHLSEVPASQAQPEPRTLVPNCLRLQLDQGFDCGYGVARRGISSTTCSFTANADPGKQWPSQELGLELSLGMKNPPQLEGDALEGSADNTHEHQVIGHIHAASVLKPKMIKRKLLFSKWRLAWRFPGLQA
ncbi:LOW QUALITY PROTEIN: neuroblastoma breakpoint family member 11-like [Piliocolobus tephrosceles]|uniref:LOW QUALITY PROTEIN: neuroblastoma breakpoint family member 11-like n=1 Tax=Piliocolobus tephrosceles TaxID=591936 RepID=UPI0013013FBA|nr:LOW QUALITY PROTEIN: neuroblastoma breakpoint family member 11-like [Piliocolobus tephrosceles]